VAEAEGLLSCVPFAEANGNGLGMGVLSFELKGVFEMS